jgi:hypothetical protein
MKKLTLRRRMNDGQIDFLETTANIKFPDSLIEVFKAYSGFSVEECWIKGQDGQIHSLSSFCDYRLIYDLTIEFKALNLGVKVPFAVNAGGWQYCLSLGDEYHGQVLLHRFSMEWDTKEEAFEKITDSLEEFIDGLSAEEPQAAN